MICEFSTAHIDLTEIVAVECHSDHEHDFRTIHLRGGQSVQVEEPREEIVHLWQRVRRWEPGGVFHGSASAVPDFYPPPAKLTEQQRKEAESRYEQQREYTKIVEGIVLGEKFKGLSVLEFRQTLRHALSDEVLAKLGELSTPSHFFLPRGFMFNERDRVVDLVCSLYRRVHFDVENTDPAERAVIKEAHIAVGVVRAGCSPEQVSWAVEKVNAALAEIDSYFGRDNYPPAADLVAFLERYTSGS